MNTYILILTLVYGTGYKGMGGVTAITISSFDACERIGENWVRKFKHQKGKYAENSEAYFMCEKL